MLAIGMMDTSAEESEPNEPKKSASTLRED
jgi:hypothetical protein